MALRVLGNSVSIDFVISYGIMQTNTAVTVISLNGIDDVIRHTLHQANMVYKSIWFPIIFCPVEKDDVAGRRDIVPICPLASSFEKVFCRSYACKFGDDTILNIAALVCTPADKASAAGHSALVPICFEKISVSFLCRAN